MEPIYKYRQLASARSIRVVELEPGTAYNVPLLCRLVDISLDHKPPYRPDYEALSYVWGTPDGDCPLICEGKTLLVTPNCEAALRRARRRWSRRTLWIDAICIDQSSTVERNVQVSMMGDIYSRAKRVVIWLGDYNESGYMSIWLASKALCWLEYLQDDHLDPTISLWRKVYLPCSLQY